MEGSRLSPHYVPPGHAAGPDPPVVCWFYRVGGPNGRGRSRTPMGGSGASAVSFGASLPQGHVASPDLPQAGNGSGAVGLVR